MSAPTHVAKGQVGVEVAALRLGCPRDEALRQEGLGVGEVGRVALHGVGVGLWGDVVKKHVTCGRA